MTLKETEVLQEKINEISLILKCKDRFEEILSKNPDHIDLEAFSELANTVKTVYWFYIRAIARIYDGIYSIRLFITDSSYSQLAIEYAEKAKEERKKLEDEAEQIILPFLNLKDDRINRYGFDKEASDKIVANIHSNNNSLALFGAQILLQVTKKGNPKVMKAYYKIQNIKEEILALKTKYFKLLADDLGLEETYNYLCDRAMQ